jgi:ankyrin repeat protein
LKAYIEKETLEQANSKKLEARLLEHRNKDGKTAFFLAVEHGQKEIASYLIENFSFLNFYARDTQRGCTALHVAVEKNNKELIKILYDMDPKRCLEGNYDGQSPFFFAVQAQNMEILTDLFSKYKLDALA